MSTFKVWTLGAAVVALGIVAVTGYLLLQPPGDLISNAGFSISTISPNADGVDDVTVFSYTVARSAEVTLVFTHENGQRYVFRENEARARGDYSVAFSGVVDGYTLPDETIDGVVERRLLPNGRYTWSLEARGEDGEKATATGTFEIVDADANLPLISSFEVSPTTFTPNQDGVRDRVRVNVFLEKASDLSVYLEDNKGVQRYLSERLQGREPGDEGNHEFDYDGGVDDGYEPPADGEYTLYAVAQDAVGQRIVRSNSMTIEQGGLPLAEIQPQALGIQVCFTTLKWQDSYYTDNLTVGDLIQKPEWNCSNQSTVTLEQGDLLVFHLTVKNVGGTPIRTFGPFPGTAYEFTQRSSTLGYLEPAGTFRVGIDCDSALSDYPWRWAIAPQDELTEVFDAISNDTFYYLQPDQSAEVWGAIRMTEVYEAQNPQNCWAGLIHEKVGIDPFQNRVGAREVEIVPPAGQRAE
ncbi:MAG: hypothetical protein HY862_19125 [Chloroflexi bacterium]|nr:hypothetical protein [Chloroflexota bacterium]